MVCLVSTDMGFSCVLFLVEFKLNGSLRADHTGLVSDFQQILIYHKSLSHCNKTSACYEFVFLDFSTVFDYF